MGQFALISHDSIRSSVASLDLALERSKIICPGGSVPVVKVVSILLAKVLSPRPVKVERLPVSLRTCFILNFFRGSPDSDSSLGPLFV